MFMCSNTIYDQWPMEATLHITMRERERERERESQRFRKRDAVPSNANTYTCKLVAIIMIQDNTH